MLLIKKKKENKNQGVAPRLRFFIFVIVVLLLLITKIKIKERSKPEESSPLLGSPQEVAKLVKSKGRKKSEQRVAEE